MMRIYRYTVHCMLVAIVSFGILIHAGFFLVFKLVGRDEIGSSTCETCQVFMRIWKKLKISPITLLGPAFVKFGRQNLLQTNTPESKASKGWADCSDCSSVRKSREQNLCLTRNTNLKSPISYIAAMYANYIKLSQIPRSQPKS